MRYRCALGVVVLLLAGSATYAATVRGVILRVDAGGGRLHVAEPGGREFTFDCAPNALVTVNGEPVPFEALKPRWRVVVTYSARTGAALRIDAADP
jgi:hypothetical protein